MIAEDPKSEVVSRPKTPTSRKLGLAQVAPENDSSELIAKAVSIAYKFVPLPSGCSNCWGDLGEGCSDECRRSSDEHSKKIDEAKQQIQSLVAAETTKARIEELKKIPKDEDYFTAIKIHPYIEDRIKELEESL